MKLLLQTQNVSFQAQYWHDPIHTDLYQRSSQFIGPINNDLRETEPKVEEYKKNLNNLEKFVMVKGLKEQVRKIFCSVSYIHARQ